MKIGEIGTTFFAMPPNFQNIEDECFCYAVDRQLKKVMSTAGSVAVWSDMDNVNPKYYGYMASMLRSPYYLSSLSESDKLKVIKNDTQITFVCRNSERNKRVIESSVPRC